MMTTDAREHHFGERNTSRHVRQRETAIGCKAEGKSVSVILKEAL
jgi:hypothetical protein